MIYVLYHAECRDGFGSAYAAWKALGDRVIYVPCQHNSSLPQVELTKDSTVYIVDFSFNRETLLDWHKRLGKLLVIDHHVSAEEELKGLPFAIFDMSRSAAVMVWNHFHIDTPPPKFLLHVQDMDLWNFKEEGTREICAAIDTYPKDFRVWDSFSNEKALQRLRTEGEVVRRYIDRQVELLCADPAIIDLDGHTVPAVNTSLLVSEVCSTLLEHFPDAPFSVAWFETSEGRKVYSLRSRKGGFDVSRLARKHGGGGHPSAAGYSEK